MHAKTIVLLLFVSLAMALTACSPKIYGRVNLVDDNMEPIETESPQGTVINIINTTATVEHASSSVVADEKGEFETEEDSVIPGTYKVEAARIGFETETETVEIGGSTRKKLEFNLKKIEETKRRTIEGAASDADKIINPGEVNIRPPAM
jgi:hypothetical protein